MGEQVPEDEFISQTIQHMVEDVVLSGDHPSEVSSADIILIEDDEDIEMSMPFEEEPSIEFMIQADEIHVGIPRVLLPYIRQVLYEMGFPAWMSPPDAPIVYFSIYVLTILMMKNGYSLREDFPNRLQKITQTMMA